MQVGGDYHFQIVNVVMPSRVCGSRRGAEVRALTITGGQRILRGLVRVAVEE